MRRPQRISVFTGWFAWLLAAGAFAQTPAPSAEPLQLVVGEVGPHHRIWHKVTREIGARGREVLRTNVAYVELASGMHYLEDGRWNESREVIEAFPGGAVARQGPHKVIFARDLNTAGAIDLETPDGKRLRSHVVGLSYFDAASGQSVLIAEVKDSPGAIVGDNQVVYEDAFTDFRANVRYTYTKGGFEQDIILLERPPAPEDFGLDSRTTRLQVLTEFLDPPQPVRIERASRNRDGSTSIDERLDFGAMQIGRGRAFALERERAIDGQIPVSKQWLKLDGRDILVEGVAVPEVQEELRRLPAAEGASVTPPSGRVRRSASASRVIPPRPAGKAGTNEMRVASLTMPARGLVLDYVTVSSGTDYTFKGDTTYYVNGQANFTGAVVIDGGTVIKFNPSTYSHVNVDGGSITCLTSPYRPAVFTSKNDNSVGETISGSSGSPAIDAQNYYLIADGLSQVNLQHLRMAYCYCGVTAYGGDVDLSHVQFVHSDYPLYVVSATDFTLRNALINDVPEVAFYLYDSDARVEHLTVNQCNQLGYNQWQSTLAVTNSLLVSVTNWGMSFASANNATNSSSSVFQTVGAGAHYLAAGSTNRNAGTTNLNASLAADLKKMTTYPPLLMSSPITAATTWTPWAYRDTDVPDLGYHYGPLDYLASNVTVSAVLTLANGVAVGSCGPSLLTLSGGGSLVSEGTPLNLNRLATYHTAQEQSLALIANGTHTLLNGQAVTLRFTDVSLLAAATAGRRLFPDDTFSATIHVQDSSLRGLYWWHWGSGANPVIRLTNNVLERCAITWLQGSPGATWTPGNLTIGLQNNLFTRGTLDLGHFGSYYGAWDIYDNLFDAGALSCTEYGNGAPYSGNLTTVNYNGYAGGASNPFTYGGANNKTGLTADYQAGPLGSYYYPSSGGGTSLAALIDAGSRSASSAGLYHHTTQTSQTKETTSTVDIGYHYVALDGNGKPIDADGDGKPDYFEDVNGNGTYQSGSETDWQTYNSPNGLTAGGGLVVFTPLH